MVTHCEKQAERPSGCCFLLIPAETSGLKQECHSERRVPFSLPPDPEPWLRDFTWEEKTAIKHIGSNIVPGEVTLFATEHGEVQAKDALKTVVVVVEAIVK